MNIAIGAMAPDFSLATEEGPVDLAAFRGKTLVLYFYPKDDTSGCTSEALQFTALADDFAQAGAVVLGVSRDSIDKHRKFREKHGLRVRLASDPEAATIGAYGCWVEKSMYGRKYMGIERSTFVIDGEGKVRALWRKVKVTNHGKTVLKAVQELAAAA